jgi:hypothetical protein
VFVGGRPAAAAPRHGREAVTTRWTGRGQSRRPEAEPSGRPRDPAGRRGPRGERPEEKAADVP